MDNYFVYDEKIKCIGKYGGYKEGEKVVEIENILEINKVRILIICGTVSPIIMLHNINKII